MGPLNSLRIIELGQLIAGPFCGQVLADFGAEVIKVEPPKGGDPMRQWGRSGEDGAPVWWSVIARGKRSLTLDLRTPEGQQVLRDLVATADVLIENFRPGTMERWGLGYDVLSEINPRLVMARVSGFGQDGPYADRAGFASVCEAMGGLRYLSGYPDRPPVRVGLSLGDTMAGMNAAMGVLLALQRRHTTGRGQVVDSSIYESVLGLTEALIAEYDAGGHIRERHGSTLPGIAPSNAYPTGDGREMIIGANQDNVFRRLCEVMGTPEMADDPRYATHRARGEHAEELDARIADWTSQHPADEMISALAAAGVPVGLAYTAREMMADPHFAARESIVRVEDPKSGKTLAMQNVFPRLSESPGAVRALGPELGEATETILRDLLGYTDDRIAMLRDAGII
ncbi:formyl-CoA transferase/succinyl-CoA--D-citramalate CoA-transferase [Rhodovulum bhavnagarense]|uniref:Formyl-CoA transferase/succinyl-CoA--D-citramalate CoA-transferase n=1 Tax=Rhodovulum bhavnagarense TaxID=992286 RepID=A0A4R2RGZ2_9RHOB|nr:CaiB/BaiF CoA-transferase family protein [Rhodovulum bhavnagarense]TCP61858.1 formyl-CoA transferase/succinyl-CoA--D-citramalate CoA-transferase [Rhodovulum bhavnagarense]